MAGNVAAEEAASERTTSEKVVTAVAEETGTDPESLAPLYHTVEPDALDALFERPLSGASRSSPRVVFTYCGCEVVVTEEAVRVSRTNSTG